MPIYGSPELNYDPRPILRDKLTTDVEEVQSRIDPTRQFLREIFGQDRVTEDSSSTDCRYDDPGDV